MRELTHEYDFVVVGGGLSGIAAAVTAAREGVSVALLQDRPVLGGTSSKEIRVPPVGAVNGGFAYCRETGIIEEIFLENLYRNPTGNHEGWDLTLLSFVKSQKNLECFMNTHVDRVQTSADGSRILFVHAITLGSETRHEFAAHLFADCTGDGTVGVLAGAPFRTGIEARSEFGETMAAETPQSYGMGLSLQFRARDAGVPVEFQPPDWVDLHLDDDDFGPHRDINATFMNDLGGFWWLEWVGENDPIHDAENVKETLQKIVYATWDYLKNRSRIRDKLRTMELDWVGAVPGKRESRRLEGDHILSQPDIEFVREFDDAVAYGGWGFDHHPREGFFSKEPSYHVYHQSLYNIPLRCLYSRKVENLFMAGRNISATHYALTSTRVMLTCSQLGEAVGAAAAVCRSAGILPRAAATGTHIRSVQRILRNRDHYVHRLRLPDERDHAPSARITASSVLPGGGFEQDTGVSESLPMDGPRVWQFPISGDRVASVSILADVGESTKLFARLYRGPQRGSTYPERELAGRTMPVAAGNAQWVTFDFDCPVEGPGWHFLELAANPAVSIRAASNPPVGYAGYVPRPLDPTRVDHHNKWVLWGRNDQVRRAYEIRVAPEQDLYGPERLTDGWTRPNNLPDLWISRGTQFDQPEWVEMEWDTARAVSEVQLLFDSSLDFTFFQAWRGYEHRVIPSLVRRYRILSFGEDGEAREVVRVDGNYQRRRVHHFPAQRVVRIRIEILGTNGVPRAQIYAVRVY